MVAVVIVVRPCCTVAEIVDGDGGYRASAGR
jgi:hypothetical protein